MFHPLSAALPAVAARLGLLRACAAGGRLAAARGGRLAGGPVVALGRRQAPRIVAHLLALSPADRARRFGAATSDDRIRLYVEQIDFERDRVFAILDRRLRVVAMAHLALPARAGAVAEFGVSVRASRRGRGLGSRLFRHAFAHARRCGAAALVAHVARDNAPMLAIVRKAGAEMARDGNEVVARVPLPGASRADARAGRLRAPAGRPVVAQVWKEAASC